MRINQVEALVGISKKNIRFYESEGLLHPQRNAENGYREYSQEDVEVLKQIKFFRKLSIPIEEIHKMQNKYLTLSDCMQRHLIVIAREEQNLESTKEICKRILENKEQLETIRVNDYLTRMEELEKGGIRFRDVKKVDTKTKRLTASWVAGIIMILMCCIPLVVLPILFVQIPEGKPPLVVILLLLAIPICIIVGIVMALRSRIKEIKGGELDEASNY